MQNVFAHLTTSEEPGGRDNGSGWRKERGEEGILFWRKTERRGQQSFKYNQKSQFESTKFAYEDAQIKGKSTNLVLCSL